MRFWFVHGSQVSIRQQLVTQVVLGILCNDLMPGQRLPSTRDLARRFELHPNTVSAGYRQLAREHRVEFRRGSGVYVRSKMPGAADTGSPEHLLAGLVLSARKAGVSLQALRASVRQWLELQPPDHFLLVEPDEELQRIVLLELQQVVTLPVKGCDLAGLRSPKTLDGAIAVALPSKAAIVQEALPPGAAMVALQVRSVPSSLAEWLPVPVNALVAVASRWPRFLDTAQTMLIAAGFHPDSLVVRDACLPDWHAGLKESAAVVCDTATAAMLPKTLHTIVFPLLSKASVEELRRYEEFIARPLGSNVTLAKLS